MACRNAGGSCENASYVNTWQVQEMQPGPQRKIRTTSDPADAEDDQVLILVYLWYNLAESDVYIDLLSNK